MNILCSESCCVYLELLIKLELIMIVFLRSAEIIAGNPRWIFIFDLVLYAILNIKTPTSIWEQPSIRTIVSLVDLMKNRTGNFIIMHGWQTKYYLAVNH